MSEGITQPGRSQLERAQSRAIPSSMLAEQFGKVYVREGANELHVEFTVWSDTAVEGWQTGVALDASMSMKGLYGRMQTGNLPPDAMKEYERTGGLALRNEDGRPVYKWLTKEAFDDAIRKQYIRYTKNAVQPVARQFIQYLAEDLDCGRGTSVIYWACGDGTACEPLGEFSPQQCQTLEIVGPRKVSFGTGTCLANAMQLFADRYRDAKGGLYIFITDGAIDDLENVKAMTTRYAREIEAGQRNPLKCVLIGVGNQIDEAQMVELDDLDTGTDVDVWDHKIAAEMRALSEVMVEIINENRTAGPPGTIKDASGTVVARFTDGIPARARFTMPASSDYFVLEAGGMNVTQSVKVEADGST